MPKKFNKINLNLVIVITVFFAICVAFGIYYVKTNHSLKNSPPKITISSQSNEFLCSASDSDLLQGVSAIDPEDGDVTESIIIESKSAFVEDGKRIITYVAFDKNNNASKAQREISYLDYSAPEIKLNHELVFQKGTAAEILACFSASDKIDGDITSKLKIIKNQVVEGVQGQYDVIIGVTNSCDDTTMINHTVTIIK